MYRLTCFHISIELPLNCRLPLNSHSRSQYTLYVCTYVSIQSTPQYTMYNVIPYCTFLCFQTLFFFSPILILTTDSPFGSYSNRNDSLTRNHFKAKHLWKSPVLSPGPCRGRNSQWGTLRGCVRFFLIKKKYI